MFETLIAYFQRHVALTSDDSNIIRSAFLPKTLKKGEFLQREGEPARYGAFVAKGFLRSYVIDDKGREHILQFAPENWWISDKTAIAQTYTASFFIDAIEDSELLLIDMPGHLQLMETMPWYAASFQSGIQKRGAAKDKRILNALTATAEERYHDFLETYPDIAQRVPQHMLASYLGIAPETLSRIRKMQSRKK